MYVDAQCDKAKNCEALARPLISSPSAHPHATVTALTDYVKQLESQHQTDTQEKADLLARNQKLEQKVDELEDVIDKLNNSSSSKSRLINN